MNETKVFFCYDRDETMKKILETIDKLNERILETSPKSAIMLSETVKNLTDAYAQLDMVEVMHIGK